MIRTSAALSAPLLGAAAVVVTADHTDKAKPAAAATPETLIRPSELPVYAPLTA